MATVDKRRLEEVLNRCNDRIRQWEKYLGIAINKHDNTYISTLEAISCYLQAYLNKDTNIALMDLIADGYQKYDSISSSSYIPTLELCKKDPLDEADLSIIEKLTNLSMFLSNREFSRQASNILFVFSAVTQWGFDNNTFNDEHFETFPSNGFQYYLGGKLCEYDKRWEDSFDHYRIPRNVNLIVDHAYTIPVCASIFSLLNGYHLTGLALALVSAASIQVSNLVSDKISITFFGNHGKKRTEPNTPNDHIYEKKEKQHETPNIIASAWNGN